MKNTFAAVFTVVLLVPAISAAYTPINTTAIDVSEYSTRESLEELQITLMKQLIVLLQMHIKQLIPQVEGRTPQPLVLGAATSSVEVAEKEKQPRRRGGGGGRSSASNETTTTDTSITTDETTATSTDDGTVTTDTNDDGNSLTNNELRERIISLLNQVAILNGDTSGAPTESELQQLENQDLQQFINDLLEQVALLQSLQTTPTCNLTSDKAVYSSGDFITLTWESSNAVDAYFRTDFGGKDYLVPPADGGAVATSGTAVIPTTVLGNPTSQLYVFSVDGKQGQCSVQFEIQNSVEQLSLIADEFLAEIETLGGDISDEPTEAERQQFSYEEWQKFIRSLSEKLHQLEGSYNNGHKISACPYTWTRNLSIGDSGSDVMQLQKFLNADPDTRVAVSGAGSEGMETEEYTPALAAAVSKFQVKYRAEILSPINKVNPTGEFETLTRNKANSLCVAPPDDSDDSGTDEIDEPAGYATISGQAWRDFNGDGILDEGEPAYGNLNISFCNTTNCHEQHSYQAVTNDSGYYVIDNIPSGQTYMLNKIETSHSLVHTYIVTCELDDLEADVEYYCDFAIDNLYTPHPNARG
jgi:hypothetical protein